MAKFTITIDTDNAAFEDDIGHELSTILQNIAERVLDMNPKRYGTVPISDTNGNTVGKYVFTKG